MSTGRRVAFIDNVFTPDTPVGHVSIWPNRPLHSGSWRRATNWLSHICVQVDTNCNTVGKCVLLPFW